MVDWFQGSARGTDGAILGVTWRYISRANTASSNWVNSAHLAGGMDYVNVAMAVRRLPRACTGVGIWSNWHRSNCANV